MRKEDVEVLGWTTKAFFPDTSRVTELGESKDEGRYYHYLRAKSLVEGALGLVRAAGEQQCNVCSSVENLLEAFFDAMEIGDKTFDELRHPLPAITPEKLGEILGETGMAEVSDINNTKEDHNFIRYRVTRNAAYLSPKANGKKNGKAKGKAA